MDSPRRDREPENGKGNRLVFVEWVPNKFTSGPFAEAPVMQAIETHQESFNSEKKATRMRSPLRRRSEGLGALFCFAVALSVVVFVVVSVGFGNMKEERTVKGFGDPF